MTQNQNILLDFERGQEDQPAFCTARIWLHEIGSTYLGPAQRRA